MQETFLNALKDYDNFTTTENGAVALKSTKNTVLDAFSLLPTMKDETEERILDVFKSAFFVDPALTTKLLFYVRDVRGGQGMRRVFRVIVKYLANYYPDYVIENLDNFMFYGRADDLFALVATSCEKEMYNYIAQVLTDDLNAIKNGGSCSLLAKWMPSENASSRKTHALAKRTMKALGFSPRQYRQMLSTLRKEIAIVETKMSANKWNEIDFEKLPARASMIYSDAFMKHCKDLYLDYIKKLADGTAKVNAKSLFPVDIIHKVLDNYNPSVKDTYLWTGMWNALPNYLADTAETGICCVDTSGSMTGTPMEVAISLGIYCADKCHGPFKNHFFTFDAKPKLREIKGDTIVDKVRSMGTINAWNTDFEACLQLILDTAVENNLDQKDLPTKLYVISDMQFDEARSNREFYWDKSKSKRKPFMQKMKEMYISAGYIMPAIVYWNVSNSHAGMFQETFEGENCCMVAGYSPSLFKAVINGTTWEETVAETGETILKQKIDPMTVMLTTLNNERYDRVYTGEAL